MSTPADAAVKHAHEWSHKMDVFAPLLEQEGEFTLRGAGVPNDHPDHTEIHGLIQRFQRHGLLRKVGRRRIDRRTDPDDTNTTEVNVYAWNPDARAEFLAIREQRDTLPCGCRSHVPDSRDDPDGVVSCKFCGEEYDRERFEGLIA
jgi:hypothetical protein